MKLFVIGNGFDLGHGLPTTYRHFREYLKENHGCFLSQFEEVYRGSPLNYTGNLKRTLWADFESNLSMFDEDEFTTGCLSLVTDLGLNGGDYGVEDTLNAYWEEQYSYIRKLNSLVDSWIKEVEINDLHPIAKIRKDAPDLFLSFNYTLVLEKIYQINRQRILHVHGSIDDEDSGFPIMGHGDSSRMETAKQRLQEARKIYDDWTEKECSVYNALLKYYDRTFKDVNQYIRYNVTFFEKMKEVNEVIIVGHSLGQVDMPYFEAIKKYTKSDVTWSVYYYLDSDESDFRKKISPLGIKEKYIDLLKSTDFYSNDDAVE